MRARLGFAAVSAAVMSMHNVKTALKRSCGQGTETSSTVRTCLSGFGPYLFPAAEARLLCPHPSPLERIGLLACAGAAALGCVTAPQSTQGPAAGKCKRVKHRRSPYLPLVDLAAAVRAALTQEDVRYGGFCRGLRNANLMSARPSFAPVVGWLAFP